jgi:hypothetical protein
VAGAQLLGLLGPGKVVCRERRANHFTAMAIDDDQPFRRQLSRGIDHMLGQGFAGDRMQHLGKI